MKRGTGAVANAQNDVIDIIDRLNTPLSPAYLTSHDTVRRLAALFESLRTQGVDPWLAFPFGGVPKAHRDGNRYAVGAVDGFWGESGDLMRRGLNDVQPVTTFKFACATIGVAESVAMTARAVGLAASRWRSHVEIALPRG